MKTSKPTLKIMCGLARSGKSTWIKKNKGDAVIVSPDAIRREIFGHQFYGPADDFIWAFAKGMVRLLLGQGKNVIVDATHILQSFREPWIKMAKEFDVPIKIVWIKTPLDTCLWRAIHNKDKADVPQAVITKMARYFEDPIYNLWSKEEQGKQAYSIEVIEVGGNKKYDDDWPGRYYKNQMKETWNAK